MQRYFKTTPPAVHQMVVTLRKAGTDYSGSEAAANDPCLVVARGTSRSGMRNDDVKSDETYPHRGLDQEPKQARTGLANRPGQSRRRRRRHWSRSAHGW